jgi:hypothetical protein
MVNCEFVGVYELPVSEWLGKEHSRHFKERPDDEKEQCLVKTNTKISEIQWVSVPRRIASGFLIASKGPVALYFVLSM